MWRSIANLHHLIWRDCRLMLLKCHTNACWEMQLFNSSQQNGSYHLMRCESQIYPFHLTAPSDFIIGHENSMKVAYCRESTALPAPWVHCWKICKWDCVRAVRCKNIVTLYVVAHMISCNNGDCDSLAVCVKARLWVCFCLWVMNKYSNHAASSLTHMFVYLDDHLVKSVSVHTCEGAVNQYVGPGRDGVCFSKVWDVWVVYTHDLFSPLSQSHCAEADTAFRK